jgi:hypothetical protein
MMALQLRLRTSETSALCWAFEIVRAKLCQPFARLESTSGSSALRKDFDPKSHANDRKYGHIYAGSMAGSFK